MSRREWLALGVGLGLIVAGLLVVGSEPLIGVGLVAIGGLLVFLVSPAGISL